MHIVTHGLESKHAPAQLEDPLPIADNIWIVLNVSEKEALKS